MGSPQAFTAYLSCVLDFSGPRQSKKPASRRQLRHGARSFFCGFGGLRPPSRGPRRVVGRESWLRVVTKTSPANERHERLRLQKKTCVQGWPLSRACRRDARPRHLVAGDCDLRPRQKGQGIEPFTMPCSRGSSGSDRLLGPTHRRSEESAEKGMENFPGARASERITFLFVSARGWRMTLANGAFLWEKLIRATVPRDMLTRRNPTSGEADLRKRVCVLGLNKDACLVNAVN